MLPRRWPGEHLYLRTPGHLYAFGRELAGRPLRHQFGLRVKGKGTLRWATRSSIQPSHQAPDSGSLVHAMFACDLEPVFLVKKQVASIGRFEGSRGSHGPGALDFRGGAEPLRDLVPAAPAGTPIANRYQCGAFRSRRPVVSGTRWNRSIRQVAFRPHHPRPCRSFTASVPPNPSISPRGRCTCEGATRDHRLLPQLGAQLQCLGDDDRSPGQAPTRSSFTTAIQALRLPPRSPI